jgi:hypothetical protein
MEALLVGLGTKDGKHGFAHRFAVWRSDGELTMLLGWR